MNIALKFLGVPDDGAEQLRRFAVAHTLNTWGYPAKDRSGRLDLIEEPHLGRLMEKIAGPATPAAARLDFSRAALPALTPNALQPTDSQEQ